MHEHQSLQVPAHSRYQKNLLMTSIHWPRGDNRNETMPTAAFDYNSTILTEHLWPCSNFTQDTLFLLSFGFIFPIYITLSWKKILQLCVPLWPAKFPQECTTENIPQECTTKTYLIHHLNFKVLSHMNKPLNTYEQPFTYEQIVVMPTFISWDTQKASQPQNHCSSHISVIPHIPRWKLSF